MKTSDETSDLPAELRRELAAVVKSVYDARGVLMRTVLSEHRRRTPLKGKPAYWKSLEYVRAPNYPLSHPGALAMINKAAKNNDYAFFERLGRKIKGGKLINPVTEINILLGVYQPKFLLENFLISNWDVMQPDVTILDNGKPVFGLCCFSDGDIAKLFRVSCPHDPLAKSGSVDAYEPSRIGRVRRRLGLRQLRLIRGKITSAEGNQFEFRFRKK